MYRTLFYVNIYGSHKLLKTVRFFLAHPVYSYTRIQKLPEQLHQINLFLIIHSTDDARLVLRSVASLMQIQLSKLHLSATECFSLCEAAEKTRRKRITDPRRCPVARCVVVEIHRARWLLVRALLHSRYPRNTVHTIHASP